MLTEKKTKEIFVKTKALLQGHFILSSGLRSEQYLQCAKLLMHPKISLTPHIGAATLEAQDRIGEELANQIISLLG